LLGKACGVRQANGFRRHGEWSLSHTSLSCSQAHRAASGAVITTVEDGGAFCYNIRGHKAAHQGVFRDTRTTWCHSKSDYLPPFFLFKKFAGLGEYITGCYFFTGTNCFFGIGS
jgi:hypothetical protein